MKNNAFFKKLLHLTGLNHNHYLMCEIFKKGDYKERVSSSTIRGWRAEKGDRKTNMPDEALAAFIDGLFIYKHTQLLKGVHCFNFPRNIHSENLRMKVNKLVTMEKSLDKEHQFFERLLSLTIKKGTGKKEVEETIKRLGFITDHESDLILKKFFYQKGDLKESLDTEKEIQDLEYHLLEKLSNYISDELERSNVTPLFTE